MIDYDLSRVRGIALDIDGVLSPSTVPMSEQGEPLRMVNVKDGYALQLAVKRGLRIVIISGGKGEALRRRYLALGIKDIFLGCSEKRTILEEWMASNSISPDEMVYIGDDIPDLPPMRIVGVPCAPADAAWEVRNEARYISRFNGGYGCVRDVLEQIMKAQGRWMSDTDAFGW